MALHPIFEEIVEAHGLKPVSPNAMLDEIIGHLGAARVQLLPTDDAIIAEHIRAAHDLCLILRRAK